MSEDVLHELPKWLQRVVVDLDVETLERRQEAVKSLAAGGYDLHDLVLAAHEQFVDGSLAELGRAAVDADPALVIEDKPALVATLAAAAVAMLLAEPSDRATQLALLVSSAEFLGLTPAIPELPTTARRVESERSEAGRERPTMPDLHSAVKRLLRETLPTPSAEAAESEQPTPDTVGARDQALQATAKRCEDLLEYFERRLRLVDEEIDVLWWSKANRSSIAGDAWANLNGAKRVTLAALELSQLLSTTPAPPSAPALLSDAVATGKGKDVSVENVALELSEAEGDRVAGYSRRRLLPITSYTALLREVGEDKAGALALGRQVLKLDGEMTRGVVETSVQLLRELMLRDAL